MLKRSCKVFLGELKRSCEGVEKEFCFNCKLFAGSCEGVTKQMQRSCKGVAFYLQPCVGVRKRSCKGVEKEMRALWGGVVGAELKRTK